MFEVWVAGIAHVGHAHGPTHHDEQLTRCEVGGYAVALADAADVDS
jgi:hypothetical protein